jgi:hypothetical protein
MSFEAYGGPENYWLGVLSCWLPIYSILNLIFLSDGFLGVAE